jgi:hypothetical protein
MAARTTEKSHKLKADPRGHSPGRQTTVPELPSLFINDQSFAELENSIKYSRKISRRPYKMLDAPELEDDFYQVGLPDYSRLVT